MRNSAIVWEQRWHPLREEWVLYTSHRGESPWLGEKKQPQTAAVLAYDPACARILEKQNRLQMSQVLFRGPRSRHQVVLLFKDSREAAESRRCQAERGLPAIASRWSEARPR